MMHHPISHLFSTFFGSAGALVLVSLAAIKAETAVRQWPWMILWFATVLFFGGFWAAESFLADAYQAGMCLHDR